MATKYPAAVFLIAMIYSQLAFALTPENNAVFVGVIDVGPGLAKVTKMPGDLYMIYDAGHWTGKQRTFSRITDIIPDNATIDLLVLSHSDSDHLGVVPRILDKYDVKMIIRTGLERLDTDTWTAANTAIDTAGRSNQTKVINLKHNEFRPGSTMIYGDTRINVRHGPL